MLSLNLPECVLSELLYGDEIVLMSEPIKRLWNKFLEWKEASESMGLKVSLEKTKVAASQRMACLRVKLIHVGSGA